MTEAEVLARFREAGALLDGHFVLRSGLHSRQFFQCAQLLRHTPIAAQVCAELAERLRHVAIDEVISPAMGGLLVGHEIAHHLELPHIFAEKEDGKLVLRRGFTIEPGRRYLVAEDVVTRGGRVQETVDIVGTAGGVVAAVAVLVDRSGGEHPDWGCPFVALVEMNVETFPPDQLPPDLAGTPAVKPGSK